MLAVNSRDALARALLRALPLITCSASKSGSLEELSDDYLSLINDNQVSNRDVSSHCLANTGRGGSQFGSFMRSTEMRFILCKSSRARQNS